MRIRRLWAVVRNESGQVLVLGLLLMALVLLVLVFGSLRISNAYANRSRLQSAADAATLAAVQTAVPYLDFEIPREFIRWESSEVCIGPPPTNPGDERECEVVWDRRSDGTDVKRFWATPNEMFAVDGTLSGAGLARAGCGYWLAEHGRPARAVNCLGWEWNPPIAWRFPSEQAAYSRAVSYLEANGFRLKQNGGATEILDFRVGSCILRDGGTSSGPCDGSVYLVVRHDPGGAGELPVRVESKSKPKPAATLQTRWR